MNWLNRAACRDSGPGVFYSNRSNDLEEARRTCARCPVQGPCLAEALATDGRADLGIRAGTSKRQRRDLRRQARVAA
jgi:hypothetical protein